MPIEPGTQVRVTHTVSEDDLADEMGTGQVPVLASSRIISWCERATHECMADALGPAETAVAMRVHFDHLRAATVGCEIEAIATLERIEGRRYVFVVTALDPSNEVVGTGRIVRVVVETDTFLASTCRQAD